MLICLDAPAKPYAQALGQIEPRATLAALGRRPEPSLKSDQATAEIDGQHLVHQEV